jgi:hypothetical protein
VELARKFQQTTTVGEPINFSPKKRDDRRQIAIWLYSKSDRKKKFQRKKNMKRKKSDNFLLQEEQAEYIRKTIYDDLTKRFPAANFRDVPYKDLKDGEAFISDLTLIYGGSKRQTVHADFLKSNMQNEIYAEAIFKPGSMLYALGNDCRLHFEAKKQNTDTPDNNTPSDGTNTNTPGVIEAKNQNTDTPDKNTPSDGTNTNTPGVIDSPIMTWKKIKRGMAVYFVGNKVHAGALYKEKEKGAVRLHLHIDVKGIEREENSVEIYVPLEEDQV